jgi:hypothetical protein
MEGLRERRSSLFCAPAAHRDFVFVHAALNNPGRGVRRAFEPDAQGWSAS